MIVPRKNNMTVSHWFLYLKPVHYLTTRFLRSFSAWKNRPVCLGQTEGNSVSVEKITAWELMICSQRSKHAADSGCSLCVPYLSRPECLATIFNQAGCFPTKRKERVYVSTCRLMSGKEWEKDESMYRPLFILLLFLMSDWSQYLYLYLYVWHSAPDAVKDA